MSSSHELHHADNNSIPEGELTDYVRRYQEFYRQSARLNQWLSETLEGRLDLASQWGDATDRLVGDLLERYSLFVRETFNTANLPSERYAILFPLQKTDPSVNAAIQSQYRKVIGATQCDFAERRDAIWLASGRYVGHPGSETIDAVEEAICECYGVDTTCIEDTIAKIEDYYLKHLWNDVYRALCIAEDMARTS